MNNTNTSIITLNEGAQAVRERPVIAKVDVFNFGDAEVRTVTKDGEAWFVANDVCAVLNIDRTQVRRLDEDEKGMYSIHTPGGKQDMNVVSEPGLYKLIFTSNKPEAKSFKRWVTHDVLPAIRKQGFYSMLTDEKLLEVVFDRCLHNEEHQTLEFQLFKMQDDLTIQRWKKMEEAIWPKRFDYERVEDADREIEDLWGADIEGAMKAKEVYHKNCCSRYGMSKLYGKWNGPRNLLAHRNRQANIDRVVQFEINSARARYSMGLPLSDAKQLMTERLEMEDKIREVKEIVSRTDSFLARHNTYSEEANTVEEENERLGAVNFTYVTGHEQLKRALRI